MRTLVSNAFESTQHFFNRKGTAHHIQRCWITSTEVVGGYVTLGVVHNSHILYWSTWYQWYVKVKQVCFVDPFHSSFLDLLMLISMAQFLCTSKHFSLVLNILKYLLSRSSYRRIKFLTSMRRARRWTKHDFATHRFHTLAMLFGHVGDTITFAIIRKWQVNH